MLRYLWMLSSLLVFKRQKTKTSFFFRAICEELRDIRGKIPESSDKSDYDLSTHKELEKKFERYVNK